MRNLTLLCIFVLPFAWVITGCQTEERDGKQVLVWKAVTPQQRVAQMLNVDDPDARREGVGGLAEKEVGWGPPTVKLYALMLETDPDPSVRSQCARAIGRARSGDGLEALIKGIRDEVPSVRWDCCQALGMVGDPLAIEPLAEQLQKDEVTNVRIAAAEALGMFLTHDAADALTKGLLDRDFAVTHQCRKSLERMTGETYYYESKQWNVFFAGADEPFLHAGRIPPSLVEGTKARDKPSIFQNKRNSVDEYDENFEDHLERVAAEASGEGADETLPAPTPDLR